MSGLRGVVKFFRNVWNLRDFDVVSLQMGKVGSSSILKSYPNSYQGHSWDSELPIKYFSSRPTLSLAGYLTSLLRWKIKFSIVSSVVAKKRQRGEVVKLIVGVRDPVSRNISGYFQSLNRRERDRDVQSHILKYMCFCPHLAPLYWIDNEILRPFGVDIYTHAFDKERGYGRFQEKGFDVFVYKLESLNQLTSELGDFLGDSSFRLISDNLAENSFAAELYKSFRREIKFDRKYLDLLYGSKMANHFYTKAEIESFYRQWSREC